MPWEKSFDPAEAIERAMQVFWAKGYAETSISDLTAATGIQRGSLYNAFAGKRQLFVKALLKYDLEHRRAKMARLEAELEPRAAIRAFFDGLAKETADDPACRGCLLVNTALELPSHDAEVEHIVRDGMRDIEGFFARLIARGQARGDVPAATDADTTAQLLVGLIVGLRVLARGAWTPERLRQIADQAESLLG